MMDTSLPLLPAVPSIERRPECEKCAVDRCSTEYEQCRSSERCRDMLRCMGPGEDGPGCRDPSCIARCESTALPSPHFWSYFACVFAQGDVPVPVPSDSCATECGAGINWECLSDYAWDPLPSTPIEIDVQLWEITGKLSAGPLPIVNFAEIAACADGYPSPALPSGDANCANWKVMGAYGEASVQVDQSQSALALRAMRSGGPEGFDVAQRHYPRPLRRSGHLTLPVVAQTSLAYLAGQVPGYDPALGVVNVRQVDCLGTAASVKIDLPVSPYAGRLVVLGVGAADLTREYGDNAIFVSVPPSQAVRIRSSLRDGTVVSEQSVLVSSQWFTNVALYPLSRAD